MAEKRPSIFQRIKESINPTKDKKEELTIDTANTLDSLQEFLKNNPNSANIVGEKALQILKDQGKKDPQDIKKSLLSLGLNESQIPSELKDANRKTPLDTVMASNNDDSGLLNLFSHNGSNNENDVSLFTLLEEQIENLISKYNKGDVVETKSENGITTKVTREGKFAEILLNHAIDIDEDVQKLGGHFKTHKMHANDKGSVIINADGTETTLNLDQHIAGTIVNRMKSVEASKATDTEKDKQSENIINGAENVTKTAETNGCKLPIASELSGILRELRKSGLSGLQVGVYSNEFFDKEEYKNKPITQDALFEFSAFALSKSITEKNAALEKNQEFPKASDVTNNNISNQPPSTPITEEAQQAKNGGFSK